MYIPRQQQIKVVSIKLNHLEGTLNLLSSDSYIIGHISYTTNPNGEIVAVIIAYKDMSFFD